MRDGWVGGAAYDAYMGRWSSLVAARFLEWLDPAPGLQWLDIGCGAGALTKEVVERNAPTCVVGVDPSAGFLAHARRRLVGREVGFVVGDARDLPVRDAGADVVVSGLALNFVPDQRRAAAELARVVRPGGLVAAYVWDYSGGMQMLSWFWAAAVAVDPAARPLDEATRFAACDAAYLSALLVGGGLAAPETEELAVTTRFQGFDDYWSPFLGGQGPAPSYVAGLAPAARAALEEELRDRLPTEQDGSIALTARAWAVRAHRAA